MSERCPRCGGINICKSSWLELWSCNDCPDPNTWTDWQQSIIDAQKKRIEGLKAELVMLRQGFNKDGETAQEHCCAEYKKLLSHENESLREQVDGLKQELADWKEQIAYADALIRRAKVTQDAWWQKDVELYFAGPIDPPESEE